VSIWLTFALLGLGFGAIYAAVSVGVVAVFRGSGIINFSTSAVAMWGVYVTDELRQSGDLVFPVVGIPDRVHLDSLQSLVPAIAVGVLSVGLITALIDRVVISRLTAAPVLAKVVATLGILTVFVSLIPLKFGSVGRVAAPILQNRKLDIGDVSVQLDRLLLATIVVGVGALVWALYRWSFFGVAIRAAAENEQAASFAGLSPRQLSSATWVISSMITTALLIVASPIKPLDPSEYAMLVAPALAVALLGKLESIPISIVGGLLLGVLQSCLTYAKTQSWFPSWARVGLNEALPFVLIVVVLFVLGRTLPRRGVVQVASLPPVIVPRMEPKRVGLVIGLGVVALLVTSDGYRFGVITTMIFMLLAASFVLLTGLVGQISVAQAAFAGASGFVLSKITDWMPFPFTIIGAGVAAAGFGVVVGIPALRIRGAQLAVVTLAAAIALEALVFRNPEFSRSGGNTVPAPSLFGLDLSVRDGTNTATFRFGLLTLAVVSAGLIMVGNLMRSATGRRFIAVRANERAGSSLGVDVARVKLVAFALSSFLAGVSGALIGYSREQISPDSFGLLVGLSMLAFCYLAGITSLTGAMLAGTFTPLGINFVVANRWIGPSVDGFQELYGLLGGVGLVATALANPLGIAGAIQEKLQAKREAKRLRQRARTGSAADPEGSIDLADEMSSNALASRAGTAAAEPVTRNDLPDVALAVDGLSVSYGVLKAVDDVSFTVRRGQVLGLIGPNGAGKTTLIDAVTGYVSARGGVRTGDRSIAALSAHQRAEAGVVRTWQSLELFDDLTIRENVMVAAEHHRGLLSVLSDMVVPGRVERDPVVDWSLQLLGLEAHADERPSRLSLGQRKLVGVARVLAMKPTVVLLDEPAAGLDSHESLEFGRRVRAIADSGIAVVLVDHDMGLVFDVCDEICVLTQGRVLTHADSATVRLDQTVIDAYLGAPDEMSAL
jgi:ABC-type branched-subunit amino acid transport system ATPase component/branched-subunit amino acid ABC-type transport system permease component